MILEPSAVEEMPRADMEQLLTRVRYGRLGLAFENEAYVVPIRHFFDGNAVWFHVGKQGKKTTYLQANPEACFQVDEVTSEGWASVICYGTVTLSDSPASRRHYLKLVTGDEPAEEQVQASDIYVGTLAIQDMTGRRALEPLK